MADFPNAIPSWTNVTDGVDYPIAAHVNQPNNEVVAISEYLIDEPTEITVSSGVLTVTKSRHKVQPESGTADNIDTISGMPQNSTLVLYPADAGTDTLTFKHGTGNLSCFGGQDIDLIDGFAYCFFTSDTVYISGGGGGGGLPVSELLNNSGTSVSAGDVVIFDTTTDNAFTLTTDTLDVRVMGVVATSTIATGSSGNVYTAAGTVVVVNCDTAAVARGQFLITSTTAGRATAGSYYREAGVFAIALTSKAGGSNGTVSAMLVDNFRQGVIGTSGWNMGGWNGASVVTTSQKFTIATETWATVAGAALPAARTRPNGMSYQTIAAYSTHGSNSSVSGGVTNVRYKIPYATETSSTLTASAATLWNYRSGVNFSNKGWTTGGGNSGAISQSATYKTTFTTDAESAGNTLSSARQNQGGLSDGTYCYVGGAIAVTTDRLDNATETFVSTASAALATAVDGYCFLSFPASAGYRVYNNGGGTSYSRKLTYATATDANNASSATGNIESGSQVTDGVALAYASGTAAANKLASSTGIYSTISNYPSVTGGAAASFGAL